MYVILSKFVQMLRSVKDIWNPKVIHAWPCSKFDLDLSTLKTYHFIFGLNYVIN